MLSLASASVGFSVMGAAPVGRQIQVQMATIADTLASMEGPDMYWEEKGPLQDPPKEESDFKEFDKYDTFLKACADNGVDLGQADITVFAPANEPCRQFMSTGGKMDKSFCNYHIVEGKVPSSALSSDALKTKDGGSLTYRRKFRKDFVDDAFTDVKNGPPRTSYKANIACDNGLIHMINECLVPGWSASDWS